MDEGKIREYVRLETRKRALEEELKQVKHDLNQLEDKVIDELVNAGFDGTETEGRVLKIQPRAFASGSGPEIARAFVDAGMEEFAPRFTHPSKLGAFVQEIFEELLEQAKKEDRNVPVEELREALPEPLRPVVHLYIGHKLSSRKA